MPVKVRVLVEPEVMEYDSMLAGPIFAPIIGLWGLASLALGIAESSMPKRAILTYLGLILCVVNGISGLMIWGAYLANPSLLSLWFGFYLTPCIIANIIGFLYFKGEEKLASFLETQR
ncbi:MAG: hypothetical protein QW231_00815 [Candidatus Bathyarchaeia archaeon]